MDSDVKNLFWRCRRDTEDVEETLKDKFKELQVIRMQNTIMDPIFKHITQITWEHYLESEWTFVIIVPGFVAQRWTSSLHPKCNDDISLEPLRLKTLSCVIWFNHTHKNSISDSCSDGWSWFDCYDKSHQTFTSQTYSSLGSFLFDVSKWLVSNSSNIQRHCS